MAKDNPYGDDAGTRVGKPDTPKRDNVSGQDDQDGGDGSSTNSGNEAARGIHSSGAKKPGESAKPGSRPGSEPLEERDNDHTSGYGGEGGAPRTSSDQR